MFAHDTLTVNRGATGVRTGVWVCAVSLFFSALHGQGGVVFTIELSTVQNNSFDGVILQVSAVGKRTKWVYDGHVCPN